MLAAQVCPTLCDPMDCSPPGSSVHGSFQERTLEWVAISFSRGSSHPGIEPRSPALQACALTSEPPGKPILPKKEVYFTKDKIVSTKVKVTEGKTLRFSFEMFYRVTKKRDSNLWTNIIQNYPMFFWHFTHLPSFPKFEPCIQAEKLQAALLRKQ